LKVALQVDPQLIPAGVLVTVPVPVPDTTTVTVFDAEGAKVAAIAVLPLNVTVQAPVPLHAPDHPAKVELAAGVAVKVTVVPLAKVALQVAPQLIPAGLLVTAPVPAPAGVTVKVSVITDLLNEAVTELFALSVTVQAPTPLQAPDQPAKVEPAAGAAANVTAVPLAKVTLHVAPQLIPAGLLVTAPLPVPARVTVKVVTDLLNEAVTELFALSVTVQVAMPLHVPDHPAKVEPASGVAVSVTTVPLLNGALQVFPQLIPSGVLVTVPDPLPERLTLNTGDAAKVAITEVLALKVTVHLEVPLHAPLQPRKLEPEFAMAVRVTRLFALKLPLHEVPQLIPAGALVTNPLPVPDVCTVS
jgi:hypothetical protein